MKPLQIPIPRRVESNESGFNWLAEVAHRTGSMWLQQIRFVGEKTSFFEGNLCGPLGALLHVAAEEGNTISIGDEVSGKVLEVWSKNDFWQRFDGASMNDVFDTTLAYKQFPLNYDRREFAAYVAQELMSKELPENMSQVARTRFARCIAEIFDNAQAHSRSKPGIFGCGQYFPHQFRLLFTLTDLGNGFRWNLENRWKIATSDEKASAWAVERGHTTREDGGGGSGLAQLKDFFAQNGGRMQIVSGFGFWEIQGNVAKQSRLKYRFPGSLVNLEINTADTAVYEEYLSPASADIF
jgi:hypothetical protein